VSGGGDRTIRVWDTRFLTSQPISVLAGHAFAVKVTAAVVIVDVVFFLSKKPVKSGLIGICQVRSCNGKGDGGVAGSPFFLARKTNY
jgi:hypothetical protein